jgi:hypothetical protein
MYGLRERERRGELVEIFLIYIWASFTGPGKKK